MTARAIDIADVYGLTKVQADKVVEVSNRLGIPDPAYLANLIWFESDFQLNKENATTGAYGLIQFIGPALADLGMTKERLKVLNFNGQMELVYQHINRWKGRIKEYPVDLYMTVFYPAAVGKPDYKFPPSVVAANHGISTPREYAAKAQKKARLLGDNEYQWQGPLQPDPSAPPFSPRNPHFYVNMAALVFFSGTLVYAGYSIYQMERKGYAPLRRRAFANPL
jgi:hypothetical protein